MINIFFTDCGNGDGHDTGDLDLKPDFIADCNRNRNGPDSFWCDDGCKPCNWFCDTSDRSQFVRGKFTYGDTDYGNCKKAFSDDCVTS